MNLCHSHLFAMRRKLEEKLEETDRVVGFSDQRC